MTIPSSVPRALLEKYATAAPRYTSYPTAADWTAGFDPTSYPALLEQAAQSKGPLSVYVHLPFCAELCLFCGCNMVVSKSTSRIDAYLDALEIEFEFVRRSGIGARPVRQYHWGGGTPTQLDVAQIERVQRMFERTFRFAPDAEISLEVDPRVTSEAQIAKLAALGFNRISLGVQDFEPDVQQAIARVQSEAETQAVVDAARAHGMRSLNIDLIYGLPHQTERGFERTVERIIAMRPERVALFHYAHVPWMKKHQAAMDMEAAPSSAIKLGIFLRALEQFQGAGYVYIGLDHFALPSDELALAHGAKRLGRNFMGYTTRKGRGDDDGVGDHAALGNEGGNDMVSLGVSSIGEVAGAFVQNLSHEPEYKQRIGEQRFATYRGHTLSDEDRLRRDVILALMCHGEIDKRAIEARHGLVFDEHFATELAELAPLVSDGLVELLWNEIRVTPLGQLFLRNVALPFDRYYRERQARGSDGKPSFSRTL